MFVRFKSDVSVAGNGFSVTYKTVTGGCGGNFTTPRGTIVSKNYPNNYPHNTDCEWLVSVDDRHNIELEFIDFDVEGASDCRYDYVAVYDGSSVNATELMKYCGNSLPNPAKYRSLSNQLYIRMRTDASLSYRGFRANYTTGCGGIITENADGELEGDIISPNYPGNYPRQSNCSWLIQSAHAINRITLTFTHMDLELSNECTKDYVLVRDGVDEQAPVIGQYCGEHSPTPVTSQGSALYVTFVSDSVRSGSGFRATYSKATSACGGDFTSRSGAFTSPGYPNSYPINTECVWTISVSPGNKVQLSFSVFDLETHDNCNYDYVELHEGELGGPLLGRFCGNAIPSNLTAYNGVWMKFRSDDSSTGRGFVAQYAADYGGDVTGSVGQISSPRYPYQYPHNTDVVWTITVPINMRVKVTFTTMDMENSFNGCVFDFLKIRDGSTSDSPIIGSYCGTTVPDMLISTTNQLHVEFHSDWSSTGQGFLFGWEATSDQPITTLAPTASTTPVPGCGGILNVTDSVQTFTSPGYPTGYQSLLDCVWTLNTRLGTKVWLNITDIDIETHGSCIYDVVKVYSNNYYNRPYGAILGTFCGRVGNAQPLISRANGMTVKFTSDVSVNGTGFSIQYKAVCGGQIRANSGAVSSPSFPSNYPANSNCTWSIVVQPGRTVSATFDPNFNIQGSQGSCRGDYVQLLNGQYPSSPPLGNTDGKYCGNSGPQALETGSNYLTVQFVSDGAVSGSGFSLTFSEVHVTCGGQLALTADNPMGTFTSPNYPQNYPHNVDCIWVITVPANERIQVDFIEDFSIERHSNCNYDFIELRDGGTINSESLGRLCGYSHPDTIVTTGNVLYARFRTDASVPRMGFKAQYKIATCGGRLSGQSGLITSPNYPSNYDNNLECMWTVQGPVGHFLTFTFSAMNLPRSANCSAEDYIEIREINSTGPVLLQVCSNQIPQPVMTSDNLAFVKFVSDGSRQLTGFSVNFEASVDECGGDLILPSGSFQSPNFPGNYPHRRTCEWRIRVPEGRRVTLRFDPFSIENHRYCRFDYVAIYNGVLPDSPRIAKYCGTAPPAQIQTSGNTARVLFRTDGSVTNGGFRAFWSSDEPLECGGMIISAPGNLTSPGYNGTNNYTNNLECIWTLQNQENVRNTSILIRIISIKLESHSTCRYDLLEAREGFSQDGVLLDQYCGNNTRHPPIITPMPSVWIRFKTDASKVDTGFFLQYNFTGCGGILTDPSGIITSPNYPLDYDHNDACAWQINAPDGYRIIVNFTDFAMEQHSVCRYDFLELFNGPYASSPSIGKFCGSTPPIGFRSQSNSIRIVLYTDRSLSARGFRMTYYFSSEGCGGLYHSRTGSLTTPNYPSSYPHNTECTWDINVDLGFTVTLTFNPPFDMEHQGTCDFDYVEASNDPGNGTLAPLGRWCGNILPPPQMSTSNRLVVGFRSDPSTNGNGFSASWSSNCGGVLTSANSILVSPGYPGLYENNMRCNYTLDMDPQHYTVISFDSNNFDIEAGRGCRYDFVAIYEGNSSDGHLLGKFCGSTAPQPISGLGPLFVQFWTDGSVLRRGFRAHYRSSFCGGVYTSPNGYIRLPTTASTNYHNNQNCTWSITVEEGKVVEFKFYHLELEAHSSCQYDYVDFYDGPSLSSPLIGRYCGDVIPVEQIRTSSNSMTINFITDASLTMKGFSGAYRTTYGPQHGCGGILNATSGELHSIDSTNSGQYENGLDCRWVIMGADNKVIRLNIEPGFWLEPHQTCRFDFLKIYDGMTMDDPLVGTYCGTEFPAEVISTSNVMLVQFYTDFSVVGPGFNATYTQQDALCGGAFTSSSTPARITSPGYPNAFRQDVRCRWTVDAPSDADHVTITVTNLNLMATNTCMPEYLELRDYPLGVRGRVVHFCGSTTPPVFESYGRTMQINYAITSSSRSTGFSLTYQTTSCNRTYSGTSGQIFSPGWPGAYPQNVNCRFNLQTPPRTTISLYFNSFKVEHHTSCNFDYLEILNGTSPGVTQIRKLCGWVLPEPVFAATNNLVFNFVTDSSVTHPGYDITYTASTQGLGCGGMLTGINGSLTSPGYPGNYTQASTCTWSIQVPNRRVVTLTFTDMRMFDPVNCATDYVIVYDQENQFGRFCGDEVPAALTTSSNQASIKFVSDGQGSSIGFRATFTS